MSYSIAIRLGLTPHTPAPVDEGGDGLPSDGQGFIIVDASNFIIVDASDFILVS